MAEDDKNEYGDEYQFSDLDVISPDSVEEENVAPSSVERRVNTGNNLRRNALIVVIIVIMLMLAYKFLGPLFTKKPQSDAVPSLASTAEAPPQPIQPQIQPVTPVAPPQVQPTVSEDNSQITQRLSALELSQQNLRSEMDSMNSQLATINSNINDLTTKLTQLNQSLTVIVAKVEEQSKQIAVCTVHAKPKPVHKIVIRRPPPPSYFIQAVIPGRAWLIAQNGSTITVREGTQIAGYGVVKLIDSSQGRIITSSGRIIRFSQQDS